MIFASTDKNKEVLEKCTEIWNETKNQIETINGGEPIKYKKVVMKIRFESDDVPSSKILSIPSMIIFASQNLFLKKTTSFIQKFIYMNVGMNL